MALVSKNIPNLINGVSQQPPALRLESQGEVQENGFSGVVEGLKKRPPTKFLKRLVRTDSLTGSWTSGDAINDVGKIQNLTQYELENAFYHSYKRSEDEQYSIIIINLGSSVPIILVYDIGGNLRYESGKGSWDADGVWITANTDSTDYLKVGASGDSGDLTSTSVADATFLVNKEITVEMSEVINPSSNVNKALVYLKAVNYGRTYTVTVTSKTESNPSGAITSTGTSTTANQVTVNEDNEDKINSNELSVSNVIGNYPLTTGTGDPSDARTNLRTQLKNDLGEVVNQDNFQAEEVTGNANYVQSQVLSMRTITPTVSLSNTDVLTLTVGGIGYEYDADGVIGWKIDGNDIILPEFIVRLYSLGWSMMKATRGAVEIKQFDPTTQGIIEPIAYGDEPFFVITSPQSGALLDFDINVTDDDGGVNLKAFKDTAKSFTDLPNQCLQGFRLGVVGDNQKKEDDFHVVYTGGAGSGYWKETVGYNLQNYLDLTTMPHTLKQNSDLSFSFGQGSDNDGKSWNERKAGDDNTNSQPSFVGRKINDIFFHRNRLGILADENVIFSEASNYFNFWRTTVRTLLDSDPIDVAVSQNEVSVLQAAVPIQDNLLLFSELNQFTLSSDILLTPAEVTIEQSTKYECDLTATPVGAGTSVFFATKSGEYSGVREFFTKEDSAIKDANDITAHVPQYLKGNIRKMAASSNEDILVCLTSNVKSECYVYKWFNSSEERLQSAWSKWTFDKNIMDIHFNNAEIYFTFNDGSYTKMDLTTPNTEHLLDNRTTIVGNPNTEYDPILPYGYETGGSTVCVTAEGLPLGAYDNENHTSSQATYLGGGGTLTLGVPYTFKYGMSEQVFKPAQGDPTQLARFQLRKMSFNFNDTGHFDVEVDSIGRTPKTTHYTGRVLGEHHNLLDQSAIVDHDSFQVGVQAQADKTNITITNDSHLPCIFQSAEWEGYIVLRNQRL